MITARFEPAELADAWSAALAHLTQLDAVRRLWDGDHTVIQDDPTECADRLGWLRAPAASSIAWPRWALVADEVADGAGDQEAGRFTDVVVLGMGGSSLFPEVLSRTSTNSTQIAEERLKAERELQESNLALEKAKESVVPALVLV